MTRTARKGKKKKKKPGERNREESREEALGLPGDVPQAAGESDSLEPWGIGLAYPASFLLLLLLFLPSPSSSPRRPPLRVSSLTLPRAPIFPPSLPSSSDGRGTTAAATAAARCPSAASPQRPQPRGGSASPCARAARDRGQRSATQDQELHLQNCTI